MPAPSSPFAFDRRDFLVGASPATAALAVSPAGRAAAAGTPADAPAGRAEGVDPHWLDGAPAAATGTAWGVPWPKGQPAKDTVFALRDKAGADVPVQSWPLAFWPVGSLKWTGHAIGSGAADGYHLAPGSPTAPAHPVTAESSGGEIRLANGAVEVPLATRGPWRSAPSPGTAG